MILAKISISSWNTGIFNNTIRKYGHIYNKRLALRLLCNQIFKYEVFLNLI